MELICPSCEARYQLPPGTIGEEGRQVSCQNCGHSWHALPAIALGAPQAPAGRQASPAKGIQYQGAGANRDGGGGGGPVPAHAPPPPEPPIAAGEVDETPTGDGGGRNQQLSDIRAMLEEMQNEDRRGAPSSHASRQQFEVQEEVYEREPIGRDPDESETAFRNRLTKVQGGREPAKPVDVQRIRRTHDRRITRKKHAKSAGSGLFATGVMLVIVVVGTMVGLYVLHPQIIAKEPELQGAMLEYVAAIDTMRAGFNDTVGEYGKWAMERFEANTQD